MARSAAAAAAAAFLLLRRASVALFLLFFTSGAASGFSLGEKTWCIARPSSDGATLLTNINYACSQVDCGLIQAGGPCFDPDSPISHASVAMNLYYQAKGRNTWNCDFKNSGLLVLTNPSYGSCVYV